MDFTHNSKAKNPLCGDEIRLFLKINKGKITEFSYQGKNCVYCQASANLLSNNSNGKGVEEMIEVCDCANEFFKKKGDLSTNLKKYKELPKYIFFKKTGPHHSPTFKTEVQIPNSKKIMGVGTSKKMLNKMQQKNCY